MLLDRGADLSMGSDVGIAGSDWGSMGSKSSSGDTAVTVTKGQTDYLQILTG